ncbi:MAG: DUF3108 domain-containing protein [Lautropia sp.]
MAAKFTESSKRVGRGARARGASTVAARIGARRDFLHCSRDGIVAAVAAASSVSRATPVLARPATPAGPAIAPRFERWFDVHYGEYGSALRVATLAYRFEEEDGRYRASTDGEAVGIVALVYSGKLRQASRGELGATGLTPLRYVEKRGKRAERAIDFDPATRTMTGTGASAPVPYPPATQDRLSIFFQLAWMLRREPDRAAIGGAFRVPLASMKSVDIVTVTSAGPVTLDIAGEAVPTLALRLRNEARQDDPRIDVWLSADADRMPLRIRFEESDGTVVDQIHRRNR